MATEGFVVDIFLSIPAALGVLDQLGVAADHVAVAVILDLCVVVGRGGDSGNQAEGNDQVSRHLGCVGGCCFCLNGRWINDNVYLGNVYIYILACYFFCASLELFSHLEFYFLRCIFGQPSCASYNVSSCDFCYCSSINAYNCPICNNCSPKSMYLSHNSCELSQKGQGYFGGIKCVSLKQ